MAANLTPAPTSNQRGGKGCTSVEKTYKQMINLAVIHSAPGAWHSVAHSLLTDGYTARSGHDNTDKHL